MGQYHPFQVSPSDDRVVWERAEIPAVGGPVDGRDLSVLLDEDGFPPLFLDQNWLWVEYGSELWDADTAGAYELEPVAGGGPPFVYRWAPTRR